MSQSKKQRSLALECMRLASDCAQLARAADNALLRQYFREAAKKWIALAESSLQPHAPATRAVRGKTKRTHTKEMEATWGGQADGRALQTIH